MLASVVNTNNTLVVDVVTFNEAYSVLRSDVVGLYFEVFLVAAAGVCWFLVCCVVSACVFFFAAACGFFQKRGETQLVEKIEV